MLAYVNGRYVPADQPVLPINDRSFLYGDGLFETIRVTNGRLFLWPLHFERLKRGTSFLKIPFNSEPRELESAIHYLLAQNDCPEGVARMHLSRGPSERGYSLKAATTPTLVITTHKSLHAPHPGLKLITSTVRVLCDDPITQHKTANRLPNILARAQADDAGADEALILNHRGEVAEASAANIFCVREGKVLTPPLSAGALAGTTREFLLNTAFQHDVIIEERALTLDDFQQSDAVFLTSAHLLVASVVSIDDLPLCAFCASAVNPPHPIVAKLRKACEDAL